MAAAAAAVAEAAVLDKILLPTEYATIPLAARLKIEKMFQTYTDKLATSNASLDIIKTDRDELKGKLASSCEEAQAKIRTLNNELSLKEEIIVGMKDSIETYRKQISDMDADIKRFQNEVRQFHSERDEIFNEKISLQSLLQRREMEIENLKMDYEGLDARYKSLLSEKLHVANKLDSLIGKEEELIYKEKLFKNVTDSLKEQVEHLKRELKIQTEAEEGRKRSYVAQISSLEAKVAQQLDEINVLKSNEISYRNAMDKLRGEIEETNSRLSGQAEIESSIRTQYMVEIEGLKRLLAMHKESGGRAEREFADMAEKVKEMRDLLRAAELEVNETREKCAVDEATYREHLKRKTDMIEKLSKELQDANTLISTMMEGKVDESVDLVAPGASEAARNLAKRGATLTAVYTEYAQVSRNFEMKRAQYESLETTFNAMMEELRVKAPMVEELMRQCEENDATIKEMNAAIEKLQLDVEVTRRCYDQAQRELEAYKRDKEMSRKNEVQLSRQVCVLLKQVETLKGNFVPDDEMHSNSYDDVFTRHLVTFKDVEELQRTNEQLRHTISEVSDELDRKDVELEELKSHGWEDRVRHLEMLLSEREDATERLNDTIRLLRRERDLEEERSKRKSFGNADVNERNESDIVKELKAELAAVKESEGRLRGDYEAYKKEYAAKECAGLEALETARQKIAKLSDEGRNLLLCADAAERKAQVCTKSMESLTTQIGALENRCRVYEQTIDKYERSLMSMREEVEMAMARYTNAECMLHSKERECELLRDAEQRMRYERDLMRDTKTHQDYIVANLETIKSSVERKDCEWKCRMEKKLESAELESASLRLQVQEKECAFVEKKEFWKKSLDAAMARFEEEKAEKERMQAAVQNSRKELANKCAEVEMLNQKLNDALGKCATDYEAMLRNAGVKNANLDTEVKSLRTLLDVAKEDANKMRSLAENFEKRLTEEMAAAESRERIADAEAAKIKNECQMLRDEITALKMRVSDLTRLNEKSMVDISEELSTERKKSGNACTKNSLLEGQLAMMESQLEATTREKHALEEKYAEEMSRHSHSIADAKKYLNELDMLKNRMTILTNERDSALLKAESDIAGRFAVEHKLKTEIDEQKENMKRIVEQNELLLNQIQVFGSKMAMEQSFESSHGEGEGEESAPIDGDNLIRVVGYLRREKNMALMQVEVLSKENMRLKTEMALVQSQLETVRNLLNVERERNEMAASSVQEHEKLLNKVEMLGAISDSNRMLREERDKLSTALAEVQAKLDGVEDATIGPLNEKNRLISGQVDALSVENAALQKECQRWKARVTELTDKINKNTSALEANNLLNIERENYNKALEEMRSVKQEKMRMEEQVKKLMARVQVLEKEKAEVVKELNEVKTRSATLKKEFDGLKTTLASQETMMATLKSSNSQMKLIARKYKNQSMELQKQLDDSKKTGAEKGTAASPLEEQERLRMEGRTQELKDQIQRLNDEVAAQVNKIKSLEEENEASKTLLAEKDIRMNDLMTRAKTKISQLTAQNKKHAGEIEEVKKRLALAESAVRQEEAARHSVVKSAYESRITKIEGEKAELQAERDRLAQEVETLTQRIAGMQRQITSQQQGGKLSAASGQDKVAGETPPTANIKPLTGPSSSKSQQTQQPVTITPWRSVSETPLASIRPMSVQTRTAAILPTSQCSASQSTVLVPPQQQLVDTSSSYSSPSSSSQHMDYGNMPSTSSAMSHGLRQAAVTPTQQSTAAMHSVESTQDVEVGYQDVHVIQPIVTLPVLTSQLQTPTVALVLPRIESQQQQQNVSQTSSSGLPSVEVASSQPSAVSMVSASNQSEPQQRGQGYSGGRQEGGDESGQVSASNQHTNQGQVSGSMNQVSASTHHQGQGSDSVEGEATAPDQSKVSSHQGGEKLLDFLMAGASRNAANSSNTVTTTQARLKRSRDGEGESSKSGETGSSPQAKRGRVTHESSFRSDDTGDAVLKYGGSGSEVEYQVPTSSQRDQEYDNLGIDSEEDEELEDDQAMPDEGVIELDDNGDYQDDMEGGDGFENFEYARSYEQNMGFNEGTVEENAQEDNEVEIVGSDENNEVPNQSDEGEGSSDQQRSEATSSGNGGQPQAQSDNVTSNQSAGQFMRRPSAISPLNRQHNPQLILATGAFDDSAGDDSIVPCTPTLFMPRRMDGFGETVSSPQVPSGGLFTFSESASNQSGVAQMVTEGIDDTRIDLAQFEDNPPDTGRSVPTTPLQSSPQGELDNTEIGQSEDENVNTMVDSDSSHSYRQEGGDFNLEDAESFSGNMEDVELEDESGEADVEAPLSEQGGSEEGNDVSEGCQDVLEGEGLVVSVEEEEREAEALTQQDPQQQQRSASPVVGRRGNRGSRSSRGGRVYLSTANSPSPWVVGQAPWDQPQQQSQAHGSRPQPAARGAQRGRASGRGQRARRRGWADYRKY